MNHSSNRYRLDVLAPGVVLSVVAAIVLEVKVPSLHGPSRLVPLIIAGLLGVLISAFLSASGERPVAARSGQPPMTAGPSTEAGTPLQRSVSGPGRPAAPGPPLKFAAVPAVRGDVDSETRPARIKGLSSEGFAISKIGEAEDKCEDAFSLRPDAGLFAVSDGASSSFDARGWARILSDGFVASPPEALSFDAVPGWLGRLASTWTQGAKSSEGGWWADNGAERGAFATLLGVRLLRGPSTTIWEALAVGDSCLLQMRGLDLVASFPVEPGTAFGSYPNLLATSGSPHEDISRMRWAVGEVHPGDQLLLLTDAVSEWALAAAENRQILASRSLDEIRQILVKERADKKIVNDDLTVVRVRLG